MDILLYLSELLQQRTSVGITGLGTFFKKKFPGRYDKEKQSFLPPGYTLQFSPEVKDDEFLASYIVEIRNISEESASYYITQFVEETNKKLELAHEAELINIGRLFYTEHEGLSFEPSKDIHYGSEFYGLPPVVETEVNQIYDEKLPVEEDLKTEDDIYEEIAEAPDKDSSQNKIEEPTNTVLPVIENIELDEVTDDFKNTLSSTKDEAIDEVVVEHEEISVPEFVKEQHEEHPYRFGHQPESELPKTYLNLNDDVHVADEIIEAPEFIKEQHAEHPNRFGNDPLDAEVLEEEEAPQGISTWLKVTIIILTLIIIVAITYLIKPELFNGQTGNVKDAKAVVDTTKATVDTEKAKQDSIIKTDSILKANQVSGKIDSPKNKVFVTTKAANQTPKTVNTTYEVIGASFRTTKAAEKFIQQMKGYGITAKIVPIEGPFKKVSLASYKTEKEALDARPTLSKKVRIKELDIKQINTP
ncbi:HU domain-containing protein [Pedobacter jejuensis]|uniref:SPOR domain-containing protein n=1 Tax=Pedobacter jejuensis TaxID=1268550 RepID=A0A3N0BXH5_9SPHI|nr:SPOR domain-containing protein [Pedobacter jejuensis]RNL54448.1 SPOR domain-containing protein [Pedobacter jejuensis]